MSRLPILHKATFLFLSAIMPNLLLIPPLRAAVFDVTTTVDEADGSCADGDCSLRDAILAANSSSDADNTINLPQGTYSLTLADAGEEDAGLIGDLDVFTNSLTINGNGSVIDASPLGNH